MNKFITAKDNFTQISKAAIYDKKLSALAFRMLAIMLSFKNNSKTEFHRKEFIEWLGVSEATVKRTMKELVTLGYVTNDSPNGDYSKCTIIENPQTRVTDDPKGRVKFEPRLGSQMTLKGESGVTDDPKSGVKFEPVYNTTVNNTVTVAEELTDEQKETYKFIEQTWLKMSSTHNHIDVKYNKPRAIEICKKYSMCELKKIDYTLLTTCKSLKGFLRVLADLLFKNRENSKKIEIHKNEEQQRRNSDCEKAKDYYKKQGISFNEKTYKSIIMQVPTFWFMCGNRINDDFDYMVKNYYA